MLVFTYNGQISFNNIYFDDGTFIIQKTNITSDGIFVYHFKDHIIPIYLLNSRLQSKTLIGTCISYNITLTCENKADPGLPLKIQINIPNSFKLEHYQSNEGNYNIETEIWTTKLINNTAILNLILNPITSGEEKQTITLLKDKTTLTKTIEILTEDIGEIYYNEEPLKDYLDNINNLQDGKLYTITKYSYLNIKEESDGVKNSRLSVINGIETIGEHVIYNKNWEKIIVTFIYNQKEPVTIREYGQYTPNKDNIELWAGLCIKEGLNSEYTESYPLLSDPYAFFDNTSSTDLKLPANTESANYTYTLNPIKLESNQNPIITGLQLQLNNYYTTNSTIKTYITTDKGKKSIIKTLPLNIIGKNLLGDMNDIWELRNTYLKETILKIDVTFQNNTLNTKKFIYNDLNLKIYWINDLIVNLSGFTYNNIHSRNYQLYYNNSNNQQLELDLKTLDYPKADGTQLVRLNIAPKKLELSFTILGDSLEETEEKYRQISTWLTNTRTIQNIPIPSKLILDYQPHLQYNVILEKIDVEKKISTYNCKASFLIPEGVGYTIKPNITGHIGINQGKTPVNPLIKLKTLQTEKITITDQITDQKIILNKNLPADQTIYFNCEQRNVITETQEDITEYVSLDSVWFTFYHKYNLKCDGAILQSIEYHEGY